MIVLCKAKAGLVAVKKKTKNGSLITFWVRPDKAKEWAKQGATIVGDKQSGEKFVLQGMKDKPIEVGDIITMEQQSVYATPHSTPSFREVTKKVTDIKKVKSAVDGKVLGYSIRMKAVKGGQEQSYTIYPNGRIKGKHYTYDYIEHKKPETQKEGGKK